MWNANSLIQDFWTRFDVSISYVCNHYTIAAAQIILTESHIKINDMAAKSQDLNQTEKLWGKFFLMLHEKVSSTKKVF